MSDVSLLEMLNAREMRSHLQKQLLLTYKLPLICLTLNIPGPVKVLPGVPEAFDTACARIRKSLLSAGMQICHTETVRGKTGYEAFFCVDEANSPESSDMRSDVGDAAPDRIKSGMIALEDEDRLGRLFDIDVLRPDGTKVSREELGFPARTCLLCGEPAHACARSRRHSVEELVAEIRKILESGYCAS